MFFFQLGPNAYVFAINNNGYVIFHPFLRAQVNIVVFYLRWNETLAETLIQFYAG